MTTTFRQTGAMPQTGLGFPHFDVILNRPQTGVGSFQWCLLTNSVQFSPVLWRLFGHPPTADAAGKGLLDFVHPDQRTKALRDVQMVISAGKAVFENLYRMRTTTGRIQISLIRAKIVRENGVATRMEGAVIDVTNLPKLLMGFG